MLCKVLLLPLLWAVSHIQGGEPSCLKGPEYTEKAIDASWEFHKSRKRSLVACKKG